MTGFAIKVIWANGDEDYLALGQSNRPVYFSSRKRAKEKADFIRLGMDDDEYQSINIVPYPSGRGATQEEK